MRYRLQIYETEAGCIEPIYEKPRPGDVKHSYAAIDKACSNLGYDVKVNFDAGLSKLAL